MYNFNKVPAAYFAPATAPFRITVPAAASPTCLSCRRECEHGSTICGRCLDVLSGDAEVQLPSPPRRYCTDDHDAPLPIAHDDHEPDTDEVKVARPASPEADDQFDLDADAVAATTSVCATCTDATTHRCPGVGCGRLVCVDCCDDAGLCPRCEEA